MSDVKHTPGPWRAAPEETPQDEGWFVKSSSRPYVASVLWGANTAETEANAQLIASAPELLDALLELCACPSVIDEATIPRAGIDVAPEQVVAVVSISVARLRKARAAIARATGEGVV